MKKLLPLCFVWLLAIQATQAHFIFLIPPESNAKQPTVQVVFAEQPEPDNAELMKRITSTKLFLNSEGKSKPVAYQTKGAAFVAKLPPKYQGVVEAVCTYGVLARGDNDPFLLNYYAKTIVQNTDNRKSLSQTSKRLTLDVVLAKDGSQTGQVLWQGKPVADAEVVINAPSLRRKKTLTNSKGEFQFPKLPKNELIAIRARHIESKSGEYQSKKYKDSRHYTTLTFRTSKVAGSETKAVQEDKAASQLLAKARANRAGWRNFPGFTAQVNINVDGNASKALLTVNKEGRVALDGVENSELKAAVSRQLRSLVSHRLPPSREYNTPCVFVDDKENHPLGRKIELLNDELHSSYRIRNEQIVEVNRTMGSARFTISVVNTIENEDGKYLPGTYVVNTWDQKTGQLQSSSTANYQWQRVKGFDLPKQVQTVVADSQGKLHSRRLTFSDFQLLGKSSD